MVVWNVVICVVAFLLCTLSASNVISLWSTQLATSKHPYIAGYRLCICSWCIILACAPMNGAQQLVHCSPYKKSEGGKSQLCSNKLQMHTLREFCDYWWLFRTQDLSHYGARLTEERKKIMMMNISDFQPFQAGYHRTVSVHYYCCCRPG